MTISENKDEVFAVPVLHGRRFEAHAVPVDVLKELEAYQRLIIEIAKALFLSRHPQRQRVPKGFEARLALSVRKVEPGSAMPVLLRSIEPLETGQANLRLEGDEFEEARDLLSAAVHAVADGSVLPTKFPRSVLGRFNSFGRSLRADEAIELRKRRDQPGPKYNRELRRKLVLLGGNSYSDTVDLVGRIYEADVERHSFHIDVDGQKINGEFSDEHKNDIVAALARDELVRVRILGTARFDTHGKVDRIVEIDAVTLIEEGERTVGDLKARISELSTLEPGWYDGTGEALDRQGLERIASILVELHERDELPIPYLYPTPEGKLHAEWTLGTSELSAIIDIDSGETALDSIDSVTGAAREGQANVHSSAGQSALVDFVTSFVRAGRL